MNLLTTLNAAVVILAFRQISKDAVDPRSVVSEWEGWKGVAKLAYTTGVRSLHSMGGPTMACR